jgi:hypothetical protein
MIMITICIITGSDIISNITLEILKDYLCEMLAGYIEKYVNKTNRI